MRVYGAAIERDLFDRGWDLRALWRARRWRLLLNVVEHLPRDSAVGEALALDESLTDGAPSSGSWRPSLRDWSGQADLLAAVHDRLGDLLVAEGAKRAQVRPFPRPATAADVVRERQRHTDRARLMTRIAQAQARATDQTTD